MALARVEEGTFFKNIKKKKGFYLRELRADFRQFYHVAYDEVSTSEALSLVSMLQDGSAYLSALDIHYAWTHEEQMLADINDSIERFLHMKSSAGTTEGAAQVARPWKIDDLKDAVERGSEMRRHIEETEWEAVDG